MNSEEAGRRGAVEHSRVTRRKGFITCYGASYRFLLNGIEPRAEVAVQLAHVGGQHRDLLLREPARVGHPEVEHPT